MALAFIRFLAEWMTSSPTATTVFLNNPNSLVFELFLQKGPSVTTMESNSDTIQSISGLVFGLCMENMIDQEIGGWSRSNITNVLVCANLRDYRKIKRLT
jgi:hypothetical protein